VPNNDLDMATTHQELRGGGTSDGPARGKRVLLTLLGSALLCCAALGLIAHFLTMRPLWLLGAAAFSPYLLLGAPVAAILLGVSRQWIGLAAATLLTLACLAIQAPLYVADHAPPAGRPVVMLTANLLLGRADPGAIVKLVRDHHVDALATQELTPAERDALARAGLDDTLPYSVIDARDGAAGVGLWSRFPLHSEQKLHDFHFAFVSAKIAVPGIRADSTIAATHMAGPWPASAHWLDDIARLPEALQSLAAGGGPVLVGGDFNATPDTAQFRRLLKGGFHNAAEQAGAGMTRSYPADTWYPPLIAIDHVLTRSAVARAAKTVSLPGSDHRGLLVTAQLSG
jgi:endonuclease/exonuclease/phosphatase (EEP) superfamily protein YafD